VDFRSTDGQTYHSAASTIAAAIEAITAICALFSAFRKTT